MGTPELLFIPMAVGLVISIIWLKIMRHWFLLTPDNQTSRRHSIDPEIVRSYVETFVVDPASPLGPVLHDMPPSYDEVVEEEAEYSKEIMETPPPCFEEVVTEKETLSCLQ